MFSALENAIDRLIVIVKNLDGKQIIKRLNERVLIFIFLSTPD
jgi:hypothetical protein